MSVQTVRRKPRLPPQPLECPPAASNRFAPYVSAAGYITYFVCGALGTRFPNGSFGQAFVWQIASGCAIVANVMAGIWLARRGEDLAAAGFTMLGIVHGVFFSTIVMSEVDLRAGASAGLLIVPALVLTACCSLFPIWVKLGSGILAVLGIAEYVSIARGPHHGAGDWLQTATFFTGELLGVIWGIYFLKAARAEA